MFNKFIVLLILSAFTSQSAFAVYETYGTRPMGMGGAFTAVADDANAPYWNPAGMALNPEVSATASTKLNNRNVWVGDNIGNLKLCYETEMNPFLWIAGIGAASMLALQGAKYLSDQGVLKKGWGREGEKTGREESMAEQVKGTEEVVSLKQEVKEAVKSAAQGALQETKAIAQGTATAAKEVAKAAVRESMRERYYYMTPWSSPWYRPDYSRPHYWEKPERGPSTKAQFALGISWLNDYNPLPAVNQNTNWYTLTLASGFEQRVAVGANINFYNIEIVSSGIKGVGGDLDLGIIAKPVEYISLGLTGKSLLTTDIKWQDGSSTRYEMLVNAGIAVKPIPPLTLAADIHNALKQNGKDPTYHYGIEATLVPGVLARCGLADNNKTAGLTLALANLTLDYSILGGIYNRTQMLGISWRF
jgi:hypothetical protein